MINVGINYDKNEFTVNGVALKVGDRVLAKNGDFKSWFVVNNVKDVFIAEWERSSRKTSMEDIFNYYDILKVKIKPVE
jgi:hypothetical protein